MFSSIDDILEWYKTGTKKERINMTLKPWDSVPEGFCPRCDSWTTRYNRYGECSECGTSLYESVEAAAGWEEDDE